MLVGFTCHRITHATLVTDVLLITTTTNVVALLRGLAIPVRAPVATLNTSQVVVESALALAPPVLDVAMGKALEDALVKAYPIHTPAHYVQQGNTAEEGRQGVALLVEQENSIQTLALCLNHLASNVHLESTAQTQVLDL